MVCTPVVNQHDAVPWYIGCWSSKPVKPPFLPNHFMRCKSKLHREMMWLLFWWSHRVRLIQLYGMRIALNAIAVYPYYFDATPICRSYCTIIHIHKYASCNSHVNRLVLCIVSTWMVGIPCWPTIHVDTIHRTKRLTSDHQIPSK